MRQRPCVTADLQEPTVGTSWWNSRKCSNFCSKFLRNYVFRKCFFFFRICSAAKSATLWFWIFFDFILFVVRYSLFLQLTPVEGLYETDWQLWGSTYQWVLYERTCKTDFRCLSCLPHSNSYKLKGHATSFAVWSFIDCFAFIPVGFECQRSRHSCFYDTFRELLSHVSALT